MKWHIMYKKNDVPQYHIVFSEKDYENYVEEKEKEGCEIVKCWKQSLFGREEILIDNL